MTRDRPRPSGPTTRPAGALQAAADPRRRAPRRHRAVPRLAVGRAPRSPPSPSEAGRRGRDRLQGGAAPRRDCCGRPWTPPSSATPSRSRSSSDPSTSRSARATQTERIARAVALVADIHERSAGVWLAIVEAAAGDEEVAGWRTSSSGAVVSKWRRGLERVLGRPARRRPHHDAVGPLRPRDVPQARGRRRTVPRRLRSVSHPGLATTRNIALTSFAAPTLRG